MRRPGRKDAIFCLLAFLYSLPAWAYPFGNDQALHWYIGKRWLEGELPFVSAISSKPIGIFVVHALSTAVFGAGMWPIRISEALSVVAIGWLIALATRPLRQSARDGEWGLATLVFAGGYYTFFDFWDTAHPELWESGFALGAWVVAMRARTPWGRDAGAGALATASFMFKFPAAVMALGVSALCAVRAVRERPDGQHWLVSLLLAAGRFVCGIVPVVLLCVLPFWIGGKLATMWEILGVFIPHYAEQVGPLAKIPDWLRIEYGGAWLVLTLLLTSNAWLLARERSDKDAAWRVAWWTLAAVLSAGSVVLQRRYFTYHFVATGCFLATLCVLGIRQLLRQGAAPSWSALSVVTCAVAFFFYAGPHWHSGRDQSYKSYTLSLIKYERGLIPREALLRPFLGRRPLDPPVLSERLAARINQLKQPGDTLCTRGFLTPLYPRTGLRCTTRHIVEDIVGPGLPDWKREYKTTLERHPPTFMVTFSDRPRDVSYLKSRGYREVGREGLCVVMSTRPAPQSPRVGASPRGATEVPPAALPSPAPAPLSPKKADDAAPVPARVTGSQPPSRKVGAPVSPAAKPDDGTADGR